MAKCFARIRAQRAADGGNAVVKGYTEWTYECGKKGARLLSNA